jgi:hypothetical protein
VARARYARLRTGAADWWRSTLEQARTGEDELFALTILLVWGSGSTLEQLRGEIETRCEKIEGAAFERLATAVRRGAAAFQGRAPQSFRLRAEEVEAFSPRVIPLLSQRLSNEARRRLVDRPKLRAALEAQGDPWLLELAIDVMLHLASRDVKHWTDLVWLVERAYAKGATPVEFSYFMMPVSLKTNMPINIVEKILSDPERYPLEFVAAAEEQRRNQVARDVVPVERVARHEGWFPPEHFVSG